MKGNEVEKYQPTATNRQIQLPANNHRKEYENVKYEMKNAKVDDIINMYIVI